MKVKTRNINGVSMSEVQTEVGSVNISTSQTNSIVDRVTPGLAIKYVALGKENYQLKDKNISISNGQFLLIRHNTYFKASNTNKHKVTKGCCANLDIDSIQKIDALLNNDLLFETPFSALYTSQIGKSLYNFTNRTSFDPQDIIPIIPELSALVQLFNKDIVHIGNNLSHVYKKKSTIKTILISVIKTKDYIYQNYATKITLDTLVKISGLSKYHLLRLFSLCFKLSPLQLQQNLRMDAALDLMASEVYSLTDIAISLGYTDLASFSNAFKVKYHCSPSQFMSTM